MKNGMLILGLLLLTVAIFAQITPSVPLEENVRNYNINTADNYSLRTRSDTYTFKNVKVSEIADVIMNNLSNYGKVSINETLNMLVIKEDEAKLRNLLILCEKLDVAQMGDFLKIRTRRIPLHYNQPSKLSTFLTSYLSKDGSIQHDDNFNVFIVHDHETKLDLIEEEIKKFDIPPKEIKIDVEIIEISKNGLLDAGIDWDNILENGEVNSGWYGDKEINGTSEFYQRFPAEEYSYISEQTSYNIPKNDIDINVNLQIPKISDIIRIMKEKQQAKSISSPSIITLNNQEGSLTSGSYRMSYDRYGNQYYDGMVGLLLTVTPHIGESKLMTLDLCCELTANNDANDATRIENKILIKEGETFLLGGMTKINEVKIKKKVPILGSILPFLFSRNYTQEEIVEVVILLTPHIINIETYGEQSIKVKKRVEQSLEKKKEEKIEEQDEK